MYVLYICYIDIADSDKKSFLVFICFGSMCASAFGNKKANMKKHKLTKVGNFKLLIKGYNINRYDDDMLQLVVKRNIKGRSQECITVKHIGTLLTLNNIID